MGFLKYIYFSQYFELKQKGKEEKAFLNGNVLIATLFVFIAGALFMVQLSFFPDYDIIEDFIHENFNIGSNKLNGTIIGLVLLVIMFVIVRFTIGTRKKYEKNIAVFNNYSIDKQTRLAKRGNYLFISILFSSLIVLFLSLFLMD